MIEAHLERGPFVEDKIAVPKKTGQRSCARPNASANRGSATSTGGSATGRAHASAYGCVFSRTSLTGTLALDIAFFIRTLKPVLSGYASDGCNQRHPSVVGLDLVEAQQQACVETVFHGAHVAFNLLAARNHRAVGSHQVFGELGFEVLART
jgi:hypothetical protein